MDLEYTAQRVINSVTLSRVEISPYQKKKKSQRPPCSRYEYGGGNDILTDTKGVWDQIAKELFKNMNKQGVDLEMQYFSKSEMIHCVNGHLKTRECAKLVLTLC